MSQLYRVKWEIDIEDTTSEGAAEQALRIQRDHDSIATVFTVTDEFNREVTVDLSQRSFED